MAETTARKTTARKSTARKPAARRTTTRTATNTAAASRKAGATKRSTTAKKAAASRSRTQGAAARRRTARATEARAERTLDQTETAIVRAQGYAEKAILIPVGATLVARDRVLDSVGDLTSRYGTRSKAERALKADVRKFERRGTTARNRLEREVKKTRTRIERQLRQRRNVLRREAKGLRRDVETFSTKDVSTQVGLVTARAENLVQTGLTAGTKAATELQKRVADTVVA